MSFKDKIAKLTKERLDEIVNDSNINNLEKIKIITDEGLFGSDSIDWSIAYPFAALIPELKKLVTLYYKEKGMKFNSLMEEDLIFNREYYERHQTIIYYDILENILENIDLEFTEEESQLEVWEYYDIPRVANLEIPVYSHTPYGYDVKFKDTTTLTKPFKLIVDTLYEYMLKKKETGFKFDW